MKGMGPREERETVIRWDEATDTAEVYTASETTYRRMKKKGYLCSEDNERSAVFVIPVGEVRLPNKKKVLTEEQRAVLRERAKALHATR